MLNDFKFVNNSIRCRRGYSLLFLLSLIIVFSGCKSSKTMVGPGSSLINKNKEQLIGDILNAEIPYKTISGKISIEFITGDNKSGFKANSQLKIIRDDIVQLSIRAPFINTEVFRLNITPDSVFVIDRLSKRYAVEDLSNFEKKYNIQFNFANMQALFTNSLFLPGKTQVDKTDYTRYDISSKTGQYDLLTKDNLDMSYNFTVDPNDRIISTKISEDNSNYSLNWTYSNFIKDLEYIYPTKMDVKVNVKKKQVGLAITYSRLDINKDLKVEKNLPSNYERVSINEILKSYIK